MFSSLCNSVYDFGIKNSNDRYEKISKITVHHMAGVMDAEACAKMHCNGNGASANYYIGNDGLICGGVSEDRRAWTSSSGWNDQKAITIEVSNDVNHEPWTVSEKAYNSLIKLCADICKRYGIKPHWDGTTYGSLTMHKQYAATACPGTYLEGMIKGHNLENDIIAYMGNAPQPTPKPQPTPDKKSNEEIAKEVIHGDWGNGKEREIRLTNAGYNYDEVQAIVNKMMAGTYVQQTYVVQAGDTLTKIAKMFNTTVKKLAEYNNIENPNLIYVGQVIKIV